jgi:hypothetical protein
MKFKLPLNEAQEAELTLKLAPLASSVTYANDTLTIEPNKADEVEAQRDTEAQITDTVVPYLPETQDLPAWGDMSRRAAREKRMTAAKEQQALAAIAAKRRLQAGVL